MSMYEGIIEITDTNSLNIPGNELQSPRIIKKIKINNAELFSEHFENFPILPGAFSLTFCFHAIKGYLENTNQCCLMMKEIPKLRFLNAIVPNTSILLILKTIKDEQNVITTVFELKDAEISTTIYVDGFILFKREPLEKNR